MVLGKGGVSRVTYGKLSLTESGDRLHWGGKKLFEKTLREHSEKKAKNWRGMVGLRGANPKAIEGGKRHDLNINSNPKGASRKKKVASKFFGGN